MESTLFTTVIIWYFFYIILTWNNKQGVLGCFTNWFYFSWIIIIVILRSNKKYVFHYFWPWIFCNLNYTGCSLTQFIICNIAFKDINFFNHRLNLKCILLFVKIDCHRILYRVFQLYKSKPFSNLFMIIIIIL